MKRGEFIVPKGVSYAIVTLLACLLVSGVALPVASADARGKAKLSIRVVGLPKGERGSFTLIGPRQSARSKRRLRRHLTRRGSTSIRGLRPGLYRVKVSRVRLRNSRKGVRRGAVAYPVRRKLRVRLGARRGAKLDIRYGTIVNPGVRSVSKRIEKVLGPKASPRAVVLSGRSQVRRGSILSARPSAALPRGLLARVTSVRRSRRSLVARLRPASIYEVAPNMSFDIPLSKVGGAGASALKCGPEAKPYVKFSDLRMHGGWTTTRVLFADVTTGAEAQLTFRAGVGVRVAAAAPIGCRLSLPAFALQGMAGPIPVYGGIRPGAHFEIGAGGEIYSEGSTDITMGARIGAVPPTASPIVSFGSPRFTVGVETFVGVQAGLNLDVEVGIGAANAANLHLALANSLDFSATPGRCSWDLNLGAFKGGGKLGPFDVVTPSSPPLFHHNLWEQPCGEPPPPPSPPSPPPLSLPFARATMSWATDSDVDLYAWDQEGNVAYYADQFAISDAELVYDVIPSAGETEHEPEIFQETADPGRTYTFGICDYSDGGEGADVRLEVSDPSGGTRSFDRVLEYSGDSAVITTSPEGAGYEPPPGWCNYSGAYEEEEYEEEYEEE